MNRRSSPSPNAGGHREGLCPQRRPRLSRRQEPAHLLVELVHGLEPEVASAGERQTREDLPVWPGHPERIANGVKTLAATFPGGDVPVLLEEGRGRKEHIREWLERAELERLHHLPGHVLQGTKSERRVRVVPEGVDADQEQHVDLSAGTGLEDPAPCSALGRLERPPDVLDFPPILSAPDPTSSRQERRMDPGHECPAVVRAAGDVGESRPGVRGQRGGHLHRFGLIGEPRPRDHEPRVGRLAERARDAVDLGPVAAFVLPEEQDLFAGTAHDVLGHVPEAGPARVQHDDPRPGGRSLPEPEVQDGYLLLGIETCDEDHLRSFHVAVCHAHPAAGDRTLLGARLRGRAGGRGRSS